MNKINYELVSTTYTFSIWELIIMVIGILCLILLFGLYLMIRRYVNRFDFDDELQ